MNNEENNITRDAIQALTPEERENYQCCYEARLAFMQRHNERENIALETLIIKAKRRAMEQILEARNTVEVIPRNAVEVIPRNAVEVVPRNDLAPEQATVFEQEYSQLVERASQRTWDSRSTEHKEASARKLALSISKTPRATPAPAPAPERTACGNVVLSASFARDNTTSDAIVHEYIRKLQIDAEANYGAEYNERDGLRWIRGITVAAIHEALGFCADSQTVLDAIGRLADNGHILTETTGKYLEAGHRTGRRRDNTIWMRVLNTAAPNDLISCYSEECIRYGTTKALILAEHRAAKAIKYDGNGIAYKRINSAKLAGKLPLCANIIRGHIADMVSKGTLKRHEVLKALYARL